MSSDLPLNVSESRMRRKARSQWEYTGEDTGIGCAGSRGWANPRHR